MCPFDKIGYPQKKEDLAKRKKKQKKKNALKYGKLKEFPTFQHDKQTTIVFFITFKKCKAITGIK